MKFLLLFPVFLSQAKLCQRQEEFSACSTKAATQISACSAEVSGAVTTSLYGCLCKQNQAMMDCYDLCQDDPQLMQQKESQMQSVNAVCAVIVISTSTASSTASATSVITASARSTAAAFTSASARPSPTRTEIDTSIAASDSTATGSVRPPARTGTIRTISTVGRSQPTGVVLDSARRDFAFVALIPMLLAMI